MNDTSNFMGSEQTPVSPPSSDERTLAILSHILSFAAGFLAPLIIYLLKKDESPYVAAHAKESLNFQLTILLLIFGLAITVIGIFLIWIVGLGATALIIIATVKASENKLYKYPFNLRLIK